MPNRFPKARRHPPSLWDHVVAHSFQLAASAWCVVLGSYIIIGILVTGHGGISRHIDTLPSWVALSLGGSVGVGGIMSALGVCWPGIRLDLAWRIERTGLILLLFGWTAYITVLSSSHQVSMFNVSMALAMVSGATLRIWATVGIERDTRQLIHDAGLDV